MAARPANAAPAPCSSTAQLMPTCVMLAAQVDGRSITTVEAYDAVPAPRSTRSSRPLPRPARSSAATARRPWCLAARQLLGPRTEPDRGTGARGARRRALPLHRLCQAGGGGHACSGHAARRERTAHRQWRRHSARGVSSVPCAARPSRKCQNQAALSRPTAGRLFHLPHRRHPGLPPRWSAGLR